MKGKEPNPGYGGGGGGGLVAKSFLTLCNPRDGGPPGSSVLGISQARILEWIAISFSRGSSQPRDRTHVCLAVHDCVRRELKQVTTFLVCSWRRGKLVPNMRCVEGRVQRLGRESGLHGLPTSLVVLSAWGQGSTLLLLPNPWLLFRALQKYYLYLCVCVCVCVSIFCPEFAPTAHVHSYFWSLRVSFHFHALEKEMATHSSVLAWRIPGTGEPGGLASMGSHRVGHD